MSETWTLGELAERAADLLRDETGRAGRPNGRVREVPSERVIRWYATIGLVDPPLTRRGRVARYGRRHLLQLVAVKRLQATGRSVADIQAQLAGATDAQLASAAGLPADALPAAPADGAEPAEAGRGRARERFWAAASHSPAPGPGRPARAAHDTDGAVAAADGPPPVHGVRLAPGVAVLLDGAVRTPSAADRAALAAAAAPLLDALRERGLLAGPHPPASAGDHRPPSSEGSAP